MTEKTFTSRFETEFLPCLRRAAAKAGCDLGGLETAPITLDQTWGDRVGIAVFGVSADKLERVARHFAEWLTRDTKRHPGSYHCQRSVGRDPVKCVALPDWEGKAKWWPAVFAGGERAAEGKIIFHGVAVATHYYPCAE